MAGIRAECIQAACERRQCIRLVLFVPSLPTHLSSLIMGSSWLPRLRLFQGRSTLRNGVMATLYLPILSVTLTAVGAAAGLLSEAPSAASNRAAACYISQAPRRSDALDSVSWAAEHGHLKILNDNVRNHACDNSTRMRRCLSCNLLAVLVSLQSFLKTDPPE